MNWIFVVPIYINLVSLKCMTATLGTFVFAKICRMVLIKTKRQS